MPGGFHRRPMIDQDRLRELTAQGLSQKAIAERLGCSADTVKKAVRRMKGWTPPSRKKERN